MPRAEQLRPEQNLHLPYTMPIEPIVPSDPPTAHEITVMSRVRVLEQFGDYMLANGASKGLVDPYMLKLITPLASVVAPYLETDEDGTLGRAHFVLTGERKTHVEYAVGLVRRCGAFGFDSSFLNTEGEQRMERGGVRVWRKHVVHVPSDKQKASHARLLSGRRQRASVQREIERLGRIAESAGDPAHKQWQNAAVTFRESGI